VATDFLDRPREYRKHARATPFLGGTALLLAFLCAAIAVGAGGGRFRIILALAAAMCVLGTIDDRYAVPPKWRVLAEALAAAAVYADGLGWRIHGAPLAGLVLTIVWIVGLVNAFNLMDNMDGASGSVGAASALGIASLAALHADATVVGMACGLGAACLGFLHYNLASPSRIFLGDGGSMPLGFLVAVLGMLAGRSLNLGLAGLLAAALTAGIVILDTTLVSVSRTRRGVSLVTGGRDHLSHRLLAKLGSPRRVACTLAIAQATLGTLAVIGAQLGAVALIGISGLTALLGAGAIAVLDGVAWRPADAVAGAIGGASIATPTELGLASIESP
jgi:UDP-GlcNAc:undecaprenyl-phosphate/decaprenyl-phosphate GlcNAc-1-phosphate transferase